MFVRRREQGYDVLHSAGLLWGWLILLGNGGKLARNLGPGSLKTGSLDFGVKQVKKLKCWNNRQDQNIFCANFYLIMLVSRKRISKFGSKKIRNRTNGAKQEWFRWKELLWKTNFQCTHRGISIYRTDTTTNTADFWSNTKFQCAYVVEFWTEKDSCDSYACEMKFCLVQNFNTLPTYLHTYL